MSFGAKEGGTASLDGAEYSCMALIRAEDCRTVSAWRMVARHWSEWKQMIGKMVDGEI